MVVPCCCSLFLNLMCSVGNGEEKTHTHQFFRAFTTGFRDAQRSLFFA